MLNLFGGFLNLSSDVLNPCLIRVKKNKLFFPSLSFKSLYQIFTFNLFSTLKKLLIIDHFSCSYCNDCRDLDLCRDSVLVDQEWRCAVPQCGQPYDREVMENALLQIVRQRERIYHLQDLVCLRCQQVKAAHLAEQCACAGSFRCKEDLNDFRSKMQIFLNIAIHQKFQLLQECTSWILELR